MPRQSRRQSSLRITAIERHRLGTAVGHGYLGLERAAGAGLGTYSASVLQGSRFLRFASGAGMLPEGGAFFVWQGG